MKNKVKTIIQHYGVSKQLKYFQSEVFELNEAIIQHENKNPITRGIEAFNKAISSLTGGKQNVSSINHIEEEIADVLVMLEQFRLYYDIPLENIKKVFTEKVDRQINRIVEELNREEGTENE